MDLTASVLVVDDQSALRDNVRQASEETSYQVLTAGDGLEALTALQMQPVDLIVADIAMPRLNCYQPAGHGQEVHPIPAHRHQVSCWQLAPVEHLPEFAVKLLWMEPARFIRREF
jgi:response regulator RpfG family c-di-GMP phosphodiesterase